MVYRKGKRSDGRDLSEHHLRKEELEEELTSSRNWRAPLKERRARRGADFEQELGRN